LILPAVAAKAARGLLEAQAEMAVIGSMDMVDLVDFLAAAAAVGIMVMVHKAANSLGIQVVAEAAHTSRRSLRSERSIRILS
jgi:hypothetical protein